MAFLRLNKVIERTGLSKSSLYALIKKGEFPSAVRLADKAVGWVDVEVQAWEAARIKASREDTARHLPAPAAPAARQIDQVEVA